MFIKDLFFKVDFSPYCERHFCKDFLRKYRPTAWSETKEAIQSTLERAFLMQNTSRIDLLNYSSEEDSGIFKYDFKVAGTPFSPKSSGNRAIFYLSNSTGKITILIVYGKDHCGKGQSETQWILDQIKTAFPEYKKLCR